MMAKTADSKRQPEVEVIAIWGLAGVRETALNNHTEISWVNKQTKVTL